MMVGLHCPLGAVGPVSILMAVGVDCAMFLVAHVRESYAVLENVEHPLLGAMWCAGPVVAVLFAVAAAVRDRRTDRRAGRCDGLASAQVTVDRPRAREQLRGHVRIGGHRVRGQRCDLGRRLGAFPIAKHRRW